MGGANSKDDQSDAEAKQPEGKDFIHKSSDDFSKNFRSEITRMTIMMRATATVMKGFIDQPS